MPDETSQINKPFWSALQAMPDADGASPELRDQSEASVELTDEELEGVEDEADKNRGPSEFDDNLADKLDETLKEMQLQREMDREVIFDENGEPKGIRMVHRAS